MPDRLTPSEALLLTVVTFEQRAVLHFLLS